MTKLTVTTKVDPVCWDRDVLSLHGLSFHQHAWSLYNIEKYQSTPLYFSLTNDDTSPCAMGFGHLQVSKFAGVTLIKKVAFSCLPTCRDKQVLGQMLEYIVAYCRKHGIAVLEIGSFGTPAGTELLEGLGFSMKKRWEFLLDIDMPEEELWKSFNTKKRNKIKKGRKAGWGIVRGNSLEHVMQFRGLALETQKRKNEQGILFPVADEKEYRLLKNMLMDMGLGRLYLALDKEDQPVAGAFFVGSNQSDTAYYMLSSANHEGLRGAAPDLLLWTAITDFQKDGYRLFNLGGVSEGELAGQLLEKSGLYAFKKTFSPEICPCGKGTLVLRPNLNKAYGWLSGVRRALG
jgi:hypothetical protein